MRFSDTGYAVRIPCANNPTLSSSIIQNSSCTPGLFFLLSGSESNSRPYEPYTRSRTSIAAASRPALLGRVDSRFVAAAR
ncbi:unannotated protein [freshwater metagenome]|uniref:Unannotated protein n=1 Tax=freshwater metagenome TaxID=449393 RepID=A0A6J7GB54_9ZZZZ